MKGGRNNLKRAAEEHNLIPQQGQSIMQVVSLRGSNLIEVIDAKGEKSLTLFPAEFQKNMWMKQGVNLLKLVSNKSHENPHRSCPQHEENELESTDDEGSPHQKPKLAEQSHQS